MAAESHAGIRNLRENQRQLDADGIMVGVSRQALEEALEEIDRLRIALRNAARNDKSRYNHHEPRPFDGKKPSPGTIWLTPREIARSVLQEPALATGDDL